MLSARAYSFRQKSRLAVSLSWVAGYTNVILFMVCGTYVSHMTGNTTAIGKSISQGAGADVMLFGSLWIAFFGGAALSTILTETARRRGSASKYVLPLALETLLLLIVMLAVERYHPIPQVLLGRRIIIGAMAAMAMGLQNATITKISGSVVRTTHVTGVTTDLGIEGVQYLLWFRDRLGKGRGWPRAARMIRVSHRHPEFQRVALLATIWVTFLLGAVLGTLMFFWRPGLSLAPPVIFLLWIILGDYRAPIADVREIDLFGDHELKFHGIVKSLLPRELGIWRVSCKQNGKWHKAPDFEHWIGIMPLRWRVIVLALSPLTRLDANAMMNLAAAARSLHDQRRAIVLAGVSAHQYRALVDSEVGQAIGVENICPDLEFAIARGIDRVRELQETAVNAR